MRSPTAWSRAFAAAAAIALVGTFSSAQAQGYAYFGQNKIAYDNFHWKVYKAPHFDIYYYPESEPFLDDVVSDAESAYVRLSKELDHELRFRIPLLMYKTHGEFEETNVTQEELSEAVGAFAEPIQNRMVLPIDQPPDKLYKLISHELTHIFQYSLFFEGYIGRALRARIPTWLVEGMASYFGQDEDPLDQMVIRDAVVNNYIPPIQELDQLSYLNYRFGHAVFDYMEKDYGKEGVRSFVYEYRKVLLSGNIPKAIKEAFGIDVETFNRNFQRYLRQKYFPILLEKHSPDDYGKQVGIQKPGVFSFSPSLSPSGELIAALAAPKMEVDLFVLSAEDGKEVKDLTKGWSNKYRYLVTEVFSGRRDLSWSPAGDQIAIFVRKENARPLAIFDSIHGKLQKIIPLKGIAQCSSPAFSPDGKKVAFEGNKDGVVDIFELDLKTKQVRNVTQDDDFDANPWYAPDGKTLLYDRRIGETWKVFSVDLSDPTKKTQLTFGPSLDLQPSYSRDGKTVYFSSDRSGHGVFNIFALDLATGETHQYTDVVGGCFAPVEAAPRGDETNLVFTSYFDGTFRLYRMPLKKQEPAPAPAPATEAAAPTTQEAEPFEPPLKLKTDPATSKKYKLRWDLEAPSVTVGVADDGTFLSNVNLSVADLFGDHRVSLLFYSVSDFSNFVLTYTNLKHRTSWGATLFDLRDYYLTSDGFNLNRHQVQRNTGGQVFAQYPINRYYRIEGSLGLTNNTQDIFTGYTSLGVPTFQSANDKFVLFQPSLVGDTTRYQSFGPFQGKRFELGVLYGVNLGSSTPGNILQYSLDFRAYKQLTRRSLLAFRAVGVLNRGERQVFYGVGGLNTLRGYDFRSLYGSNVVGMNFELRFPFVDELRFPFGPIRDIRGFFFSDLGTAWLPGDQFYDPDTRTVRVRQLASGALQTIPFSFWDSKNDRLQDLRGSYGLGFQFFFLGGLQFNWVWAKRMPYTVYLDDPTTLLYDPVPTKAKIQGLQSEFYIAFDW